MHVNRKAYIIPYLILTPLTSPEVAVLCGVDIVERGR